MQDKSKEWNKLTGRKILVYDPDLKYTRGGTRTVIQTMRIEGCDPYVGICVAYMDGTVFWVSHGNLSPRMQERNMMGTSFDTLNLIYNQIRSGYFSVPIVEKYIDSLGKVIGFGATCPFSM